MKPLPHYQLVSDQVTYVELIVIMRELRQAISNHNVTSNPTAVVEFGCYVGTTSVFLQRMLAESAPAWTLHVYDSFAGLPQKSAADASVAGDQFRIGELTASKATLIANFRRAGLRLPIIHKAWFSNLTGADIPNHIAFAFLDGDYYQSIMDSLVLITPKLSPGAVIVVDDYQSSALPGATKAVDDWLRMHPSWYVRHEQTLAILKQH